MNPLKKIPNWAKNKYFESNERKAIEAMVTNKVVDYFYKDYEKVLEKTMNKENLTNQDKKSLNRMVHDLQKGKGYTKRTRTAFEKDLPKLVERICNGKTIPNDYTDLADIKEFVTWSQKNDRIELLTKRKVF